MEISLEEYASILHHRSMKLVELFDFWSGEDEEPSWDTEMPKYEKHPNESDLRNRIKCIDELLKEFKGKINETYR